MRKYCNSTDIHPRRQMDGSMATEKPLSSPATLPRAELRFSMRFSTAQGKQRVSMKQKTVTLTDVPVK